MSEYYQNFTDTSQQRTNQALTIVRYILSLPDSYTKAIVHNFPLGTVLGPKRSLLNIDADVVEKEVNESIKAIGGIPAVVESPDSVTHINLVQWLGPHSHDPAMHQWIGQIADTKAHVSAPIRGVEADLLNGNT